jgi:glycosyltransferase involved in cell wall biosynthesis
MVCYSFYESDNRVMRYARSLAARGDHVDVIALSRTDDYRAKETIEGVCVYKVQRRDRNEKNRFAYLGRILRFLLVSGVLLTRRHLHYRYDIVHVHNIPDFLVFSACLAKLTGAAIILDIHDIVPEFYSSKFSTNGGDGFVGLLKALERVSTAFADHVIISNHLWFELITSRSVKREKCSVFINYVDADVFKKPDAHRKDGRRLVIYPGGLQWHQGLDIAIRAFAKVSEQVPAAEFHIYGEGPEKERLVTLAQALGLSEKVLFFRSLPLREVSALMAEADLAVVPKRANSFGNQAYSTKIMEFMALGVPLVVSKTRIDSFYFDDSLVRFCESENVEDFASGMVDLLTNDALCRQLISNAQKYVAANHWGIRKQDYLELVDRLISGVKESDGSRSPGVAADL